MTGPRPLPPYDWDNDPDLDGDPLDPAKGILIGTLAGLTLWAAIAAAVYWWLR